MQTPRILPALALTALLFSAPPSPRAQTKYFVVPSAYAKVEAPSRNTYPFSYDEVRTQMIYNGKKLGFKIGAITEAAFRRDGTYSSVFNAKKLPLKVWISKSPNTDKSASVCFAQNRGPNPKLVFSGTLNLPRAGAPSTPPAPFSIVIPFSPPWIYTGGNICLEIVAPGPYRYGRWMTDTYYNSEQGRGTALQFGRACAPAGGGKTPKLKAYTYRLLIGKTAYISLYAYRNSVPCFMFLGTSKTAWGSIKLPFDMTPLGATGCKIYTGAAAILTATSHPSYSSGITYFCFFVPEDPSFLGQHIYSQGFVVDPKANAMGLLSTEGWDVTFGRSYANWEGVQSIFSRYTNVGFGSTSSGANGHITRFGGSLN